MTFFGIAGVLGNLLVITTFVRYPHLCLYKMRQPLVANIACTMTICEPITECVFDNMYSSLRLVCPSYRSKVLRTPPNMLLINLAISDMSFSAINGFPLLTISAINKKWVWGKLCEYSCSKFKLELHVYVFIDEKKL